MFRSGGLPVLKENSFDLSDGLGPDNLDTLPMPTLEIELPVEPESQPLPAHDSGAPEEIPEILRLKTLRLGEEEHDSHSHKCGGEVVTSTEKGMAVHQSKEPSAGLDHGMKLQSGASVESHQDTEPKSKEDTAYRLVLHLSVFPKNVSNMLVNFGLYQVLRITNDCPEDSDPGGSDRPAALDNIRPIKPENQKTKAKGKGKGKGRGRGRGYKDHEESDGPKPKRRRTRKKKEDVEEDQDEQKEDKVCKDEKPGKVSKTKGKKVETTKGRKGKKEEGQASDGKEKPKLDDEETVGKKLKPKVPPCESQDRKGDTTLAPKSKARKRKPTQDDTGLDKRDSSSKGSTTTKDQSDEKPSSSKDKPSRRRKARAPKGSTSSKSKNSEVEKTKSKRAKGDEKNSDAKAAAKAKLSRKSAAYHRAKVAALKEGKDEKTAKDLGREVALKCFSTFYLEEKS